MSTSTKIIKALIQVQINALINSAPGTLDTLGEIAAALAAEDSAIAALAAVNNTQNTNIAALQTQGTSQAAQINALTLRNGILRQTIGADLTLTLTAAGATSKL
jgi:hypothetical protein